MKTPKSWRRGLYVDRIVVPSKRKRAFAYVFTFLFGAFGFAFIFTENIWLFMLALLWCALTLNIWVNGITQYVLRHDPMLDNKED